MAYTQIIDDGYFVKADFGGSIISKWLVVMSFTHGLEKGIKKESRMLYKFSVCNNCMKSLGIKGGLGQVGYT